MHAFAIKHRRLSVIATVVLIALPIRQSLAHDWLGIYLGAAAGQSRVEAVTPYDPDFRENEPAFKVLAGIRPISMAGAEVAYEDFGRPSHQTGFFDTDVKMKGESAFAVLYLPIPVIEVFFKAGLARIDSTATSKIVCPSAQTCIELAPAGPVSRTNTGFAAGAGAQFKIKSVAVRADYERFNAAGGNPSLLTLGIIWRL